MDDKANTIYANVMVFMGIIATIFTLITINFEAFKSQDFSMINIVSMNLSLAFVVFVLAGIILFFVNKKHSPWVYIIFALITISLLAINILLCFIK